MLASSAALGVHAVDGLQVLSPVPPVLEPSAYRLGCYGDLLDRESFIWLKALSPVPSRFSASPGLAFPDRHRGQWRKASVPTGFRWGWFRTERWYQDQRLHRRIHQSDRIQRLDRRIGINFVVEGLGTRLVLVTASHREDESGRTVHRLNASQVISDQVRHGASDQGDQNGVETQRGHLFEKRNH